jgi:ribosomal protein S18 acetylase RimI-like enzyme
VAAERIGSDAERATRRLRGSPSGVARPLETPHSGLLRPLEDRVRELWARLDALGSEDAFWFVAPRPGELIGSVGVREVRPSPLVVPVMEIRDLVVDRNHRRAGIGRALLERAFSWGREQGLHGAMLEVAEANTAAMRLYLAHGMYSTGRTLVCDLKQVSEHGRAGTRPPRYE